jgi:hypothetical protein
METLQRNELVLFIYLFIPPPSSVHWKIQQQVTSNDYSIPQSILLINRWQEICNTLPWKCFVDSTYIDGLGQMKIVAFKYKYCTNLTNCFMRSVNCSSVRVKLDSCFLSNSPGIFKRWPSELERLTTRACGRSSGNSTWQVFNKLK